jgi:predicted transposase YbfD/YdcC
MMSMSVDASLLTHFSSLEGLRRAATIEHQLIDIVAIAICAVVCGAESWTDLEEYGKAKQAWLETFLSLPNGIPSHDTFARVLARLEPQQMQECFLSWIRAVSQLTLGEVVAIDGKELRHSYDQATGKRAIAMVSAWASTNRLVLGQRKVDEKSNEITAIPQLLQVLALSGCALTIDAMGCQKEIANAIVDRGADYVLALKANQPSLYEDVQWLFEQAGATNFQGVAHDFQQTINKGHGRIEIRRCWTLKELDYLVQKPHWRGLASLAMVQSERRCKGKVEQQTRYYISSLTTGAKSILQAVRSHWGIETSLHWVLDVAFDEDDCRIRKDYAPQNFSLLRQIALNLLSQEKTTKVGVKAKRKKAGWDDTYLIKVLAQS